MKKSNFILTITLLFTLLTSCSRDTINGSDDITSEFRTVSNFTKISSEGVFEVTITKGTSQSVEITANNNIISEVKTRVVNNELQLYLDDDHNYRDISIQVNIFAENLNGLKNSGVGNMYVYDVDESGTFSINNSGTASISIDGVATSLNILNEGSGKILAFEFMVSDCTIDIIGSGSVEVSCSDNLDIDIEGSGNVYYKGDPLINTTITGSGNVLDAN